MNKNGNRIILLTIIIVLLYMILWIFNTVNYIKPNVSSNTYIAFLRGDTLDTISYQINKKRNLVDNGDPSYFLFSDEHTVVQNRYNFLKSVSSLDTLEFDIYLDTESYYYDMIFPYARNLIKDFDSINYKSNLSNTQLIQHSQEFLMNLIGDMINSGYYYKVNTVYFGKLNNQIVIDDVNNNDKENIERIDTACDCVINKNNTIVLTDNLSTTFIEHYSGLSLKNENGGIVVLSQFSYLFSGNHQLHEIFHNIGVEDMAHEKSTNCHGDIMDNYDGCNFSFYIRNLSRIHGKGPIDSNSIISLPFINDDILCNCEREHFEMDNLFQLFSISKSTVKSLDSLTKRELYSILFAIDLNAPKETTYPDNKRIEIEAHKRTGAYPGNDWQSYEDISLMGYKLFRRENALKILRMLSGDKYKTVKDEDVVLSFFKEKYKIDKLTIPVKINGKKRKVKLSFGESKNISGHKITLSKYGKITIVKNNITLYDQPIGIKSIVGDSIKIESIDISGPTYCINITENNKNDLEIKVNGKKENFSNNTFCLPNSTFPKKVIISYLDEDLKIDPIKMTLKRSFFKRGENNLHYDIVVPNIDPKVVVEPVVVEPVVVEPVVVEPVVVEPVVVEPVVVEPVVVEPVVVEPVVVEPVVVEPVVKYCIHFKKRNEYRYRVTIDRVQLEGFSNEKYCFPESKNKFELQVFYEDEKIKPILSKKINSKIFSSVGKTEITINLPEKPRRN